MYKINLHAHSRWSDGSNTIREMATAYKEMGFCCAVITDHVYRKDPSRPNDDCSLNSKKFEAACAEAEIASDELNFPIFLGAEFTIGFGEEILVFGLNAIKYLLEIRDLKSEVDYDNLRAARKLFNSAAIMAHPMNPSIFIYEDAIDGFEFHNGGTPMFNHRPVPKNLNGLTPWGNSDAHCDYALAGGYNFVPVNVQCEADLIDLVRNHAPRFMYANRWETLGDLMMEATE